jgi:hypothetical protein
MRPSLTIPVVAIVAAREGVIADKFDGEFDENCAISNADWNGTFSFLVFSTSLVLICFLIFVAVYVLHDDGTYAWYGHMKKNSLTTKAIGEPVAVGDFLGYVGSSGSSTIAHLHFELQDESGNVVDPWYGPCNTEIGEVTGGVSMTTMSSSLIYFYIDVRSLCGGTKELTLTLE